MGKKSTTLLLISLGVVAVLMAYFAGLFDWILDYSGEAKNDTPGLFSNTVKIVALLAYAYFGIRFFNRCVSEQV